MLLKQPSTTSRFVRIYLRDHYAGATAGVALFRRAASSHSDAEARAELGRLAKEIAQDRNSLRAMMRSMRIRPARTKALVAWIGEKVGRLKTNGRLFRRSPLSDVIELEGLQMGVKGKAALWQSLLQVAERDQRIDRSVLERLASRADEQIARLERIHRTSAQSTFS